MSAAAVKCWICGTEYEQQRECPQCGIPQSWGPTREDYARLAEDDKREDPDPIKEGDDAYARDVCVPRCGPL